ncbi:MAG: penicillin-binding protein 2 [Chloroflexota bacterium]
MKDDLDAENRPEPDEEAGPPRLPRRAFFQLTAAAAAAVIVRQLWQLQVIDGTRYRLFAEENRTRQATVKAARGVIYDRKGTLLVRNVPSYTVAIIPAALPTAGGHDVFRRLAALLGTTIEALEATYAKERPQVGEFSPVPIKRYVTAQLAFALEEQHLALPGVTVVVDPVREYREGPLLSHVVGYIGRISEEQFKASKADTALGYEANDTIGQTGLENSYEEELRGLPGAKVFEVDSTEREVGTVRLDQPKAGHSLVLSIDLDMQRAVADILAQHIDEYGAAVGLVMDPNNGQMLALVDLPTYDNNLLVQGVSPADIDRLLATPYYPLLNKAISSAFPPGSTFKIVAGSGALQAGVVEPNTIVNCPGGILVPSTWGGGAWLKCWASHGKQDLVAGLANSCDVYFYHLAGGEPQGKWPGLGPERLADYARAFGLGAPTGIDLPTEVGGLVPDPAWKEANVKEPWYRGDTYIMGIGQSFLQVSPLQMLVAMAAIANGGTLYRPQVVREIRDEQGNVVRPFRPQVTRDLPIAAEHLAAMREGLRANMTYGKTANGATYWGTAWDSEVKGAHMAGKTGTAESILKEKGEYQSHGWFVAFAPEENPKVVVLVFVQNGKGPQHAAKRVAEIMRYIFKLPEEEKA